MKEFTDLLDLTDTLLGPNGCPWDQEQTFESLRKSVVEEVYELVEAVDEGCRQKILEELGDLAFNFIFFCKLGEKEGAFSTEDVLKAIYEKLVRRHPHVFGNEDDRMKTAEEVIDRWESIKALEKKEKGLPENTSSLFKDLPPRLPALLFAYDIYKRVRKAGLERDGDWEQDIASQSNDLTNEEAGKRLFEIVGACREAGIDPESALRRFASSQVRKLDSESKAKKG